MNDTIAKIEIGTQDETAVKNDLKSILERCQERERQFETLIPESIENKIVKELNEKHAVVHTDQFYILTEKPHSLYEGIDFALESKQSFLNMYENQNFEGSNEKTYNKAKFWLKHQDRRQYPNGIAFDPTSTEHTKGRYNIWKGFSLKPVKGNCQLFKNHILEVICSGNKEYYRYVFSWIAHLVQKPHELLPGLVLMGEQGTGKNSFVDAIGIIFGSHYLPLDNIDQFLGNFNFHLKNAVLIHGNEAVWGGNKKELGKLKAMVTEKFCVIEGKGKDQISMRNFKHLILSSNEDWPVHLDRDDRRFFVLKVSNKHKQNRPYFKDLHKELKNGGLEALLYDLLNEDISEFDPHIIPQSLEAFEIKMQSAPSVEKYLYEVLKVGSFDIGKVGQTGNWQTILSKYSILTDTVFIDYKDWCEHQGIKPESDVYLGRAIKKLIPSMDKSRSRQYERKAQYDLPGFSKAREEFQIAYKVGAEIWEC